MCLRKDEGLECFTAIKNGLVVTALGALIIGAMVVLCGCENPSSGDDEEKTEITAQSGSTVIVNTGDGTATVNQSEEQEITE